MTYAARMAKQYGAIVVLNPAPAPTETLPSELLSNVDVIIPNSTEIETITKRCVTDLKSAQDAIGEIISKGVKTVIVTLGSEGTIVFHDGEYKEKDIDVEICERVTQMKPDSEILKFREINRVENAVCVLHKGAYNKLREAYTYTFTWIEDNNYEVIDNPRESYIDDIWNKESEEEWLTEIQVPIKLR